MTQRLLAVACAVGLLAAPVSARPARPLQPPQVPTITLLYVTGETSTSVEVVWNTNISSDSRVE